MKDYYQILEVHYESTQEEIKRSYRVLVQKYHPDINGNNKLFEEKLKEINIAYSILGDPSKKAIYDLNLKKSNSNYKSETNFQSQHGQKQETKQNNKRESEENNKNSHNTKMDSKTYFKKEILSKPFSILSILAFVGIVLVVYNWKSITTYFEEKQNKADHASLIRSIQATKTFTERSLYYLNIPTLNFESRWKDGKMYYKFSFTGATKSKYENKAIDKPLQLLLEDAKKTESERNMNNLISFDINLLDKAGFIVHTIKIDKSDMTKIVDNDGKVLGYSINTNIQIAPELYKEFDNWEFTYREIE